MNLTDRLHAIDFPVFRHRLARLVALCCAAGVALTGEAQSVSTAEPAPSAPPPGLQLGHDADGLTDRAMAPFQWKIFAARPHASYRLTRGDGLQFRPGQQTTTTTHTVSAGLLVEIGRRWIADYTPTWTSYSNPVFKNTVDHSAMISGTVSFTDGELRFDQRYSSSDSPRIETGRQTHEETSTTSVSGNYRLSRKSRIEVVLSQNLRYIGNAPNAYEWSMRDWYHYQVSNRVDAAVGVSFGYVDVEPGVDMTYTRPEARIGWRPTEKLGFDVHAGAEQRKFRRAGSDKLNSPTYGASAFYQPFAVTTISLAAQRGVSVSYFANQVTESTSWSLGLNQRLLERFTLNASASRSTNSYLPVASGPLVSIRDDTSYTYNVRLSTSFLRRGTIGIVYQHTRNASDVALYSFSSNQIGLEVGYRY